MSPSSSRKASPYHSEEAGRPASGRWPRRSPPRGLSRGFGVEPGRSGSHSLALFTERQPRAIAVDDDGVAFAEVSFEDPHRERIEHATLNRALERPGAVRRVVAFLDELFFGCVSEHYMNLALFEALHQPGELDLDDVLHVLTAERVEEDDFVDAIQKLGPEVFAE